MLVPPAPYQLRPLALTDLEAVLAIDALTFPTPTKATLFRHELTNNQLAHYQALLGKNGCLLGFAGYWLMADEAHISTIAVHPDWQRRGLGELLLLNMLYLQCEQQASLSTLEVRRSNRVAQALYHKYGYELVGERPRYYKNGEDALLLTRYLVSDRNGEDQFGRLRRVLYARLHKADWEGSTEH
jgi:[ribosomal protein S18]-alanine N-acetyltransferase